MAKEKVVSKVRPRGQIRKVQTVIEEPSLTRQSETQNCNIHCILDKFRKTGLLPQRTVSPLRGAIPDVDSFHSAMNIMTEAQQMFEAMPSDLRQEFDNDPAKFIDFCGKEENKEKMIELGLMDAPEPEPVYNDGSPNNNIDPPADPPADPPNPSE